MTKKNAPPDEQAPLYDKLIENHPDIERKGATMPYTSLNGNMFTFLDKEGFMGLRLGKDEREVFLKKHSTELMVQHGAVMKEYVRVPPELLARTEQMTKYLQLSFTYVESLKPKPTKRKK